MAIVKHGEQQVLDNLRKFISTSNGNIYRGLEDAFGIVKQAVIPLTPVDTGDMRASFFKKRRVAQGSPYIIIGNSQPYSLEQHENFEYRHTEGEAKFLEKATFQNIGRIGDAITGRLKI